MAEEPTAPKVKGSKPRKRFVGSKTAKPSKPGVAGIISHQVPQDILQDDQLNAAIAQLPSNYSFEIHKTIHHVRKNNATMVALQMPEGLQMFACTIADIIERFTNALTVIMGDVTYGACCVDDYTAVALGCDMLVHYGHSCLVPMDQTSIKTLYVFVEIAIDSHHLVQTIRLNFPSDRDQFHETLLNSEETDRLIPAGTKIGSTSHLRIEAPSASRPPDEDNEPSSGSTSYEPTRLALVSTIQFVAALQRLKEDLTEESFIVDPTRPDSGTLGRQGNFRQLQAITNQLQASKTPIPYIPILLSELSPAKLSLFNPHISTFIQTSCPRLSIDWGYAFDRPLLSPYEAAVAVGKTRSWTEDDDGRMRDLKKEKFIGNYPMDFYAAGSPWAVSRTTAAF
ncbi:hypothetical protein H0H93_007700 [Arthromyces matolae]|nr:hypothetical protein H0H93_007700 [Arthromyces matolae]